MDADLEKSFVGIDVAEAANDSLIQNGSLDGRVFVFLEFGVKFVGGHGPGFFGELFDELIVWNLCSGERPDKTKFTLVIKKEGAILKL